MFKIYVNIRAFLLFIRKPVNRDFEKIKEAMELIKENDIVKYTELLIEYMKVDALYTINNSLVDIELNLRH